MNIYRVNLNLLKVFAVLMREQHVSAAAKCLHLTQPAIAQIWHRQQDNDSGIIWLRTLIKNICDQVFF